MGLTVEVQVLVLVLYSTGTSTSTGTGTVEVPTSTSRNSVEVPLAFLVSVRLGTVLRTCTFWYKLYGPDDRSCLFLMKVIKPFLGDIRGRLSSQVRTIDTQNFL